MPAYEVVINKKFTHLKLYNVKKSIRGGQDKFSKMLTDLVTKYIVKKNSNEPGENKV